jgi:thiamine-monophosphate kinase
MEQSFLAWLRGRAQGLPQEMLGIGDDAAILQWPPSNDSNASNDGGTNLVLATDQIVDQVDFLLDAQPLDKIGRKSVLINLSDMAAMAATPRSILVTLTLPRENATQIAAGIYEGILAVANEYQLSIAGGDITVYDGPAAISVTIVGSVPENRRWLRSGAEEGDAIVVTGALGGSILGRHLEPQPRVEAALKLASEFNIRAAIDVSDGLSLDLDRLCAASGVGAEFELSKIPLHEDALRLAQQDGQSAIDHAWGDGEDFELILAVSPSELTAVLSADVGVPLTQIGTFTGRTGLWARQADADGKKSTNQLVRMSPRGFIHGRR